MSVKTRTYLKAKFETGDVPTQDDFHNWLDSFIHLTEDLINDLTTGGTTKALTAQQGVELKALIDTLEGELDDAVYLFGLDTSAADVLYSNLTSLLSADNVQDAIDELKGEIDDLWYFVGNLETGEHDYKTWYVDGENGSDSNVGTFNAPFETIQTAYNARIADGFNGFGFIKIMTDSTYSGLVAGLTSLYTTIKAEVPDVNLGGLDVTDVEGFLFLEGIASTGTITINQTGTNYNYIGFIDTITTSIQAGSVADADYIYLEVRDKAVVKLSNLSPDCYVDGYKGGTVELTSAQTKTRYIDIIDGTLQLGSSAGINLAELIMTRGRVNCRSTSGMTVTDFTHEGVAFTRKNKITVSGTETVVPGEWAPSETRLSELSADPSDPGEGQSVIWQSNGTGSGDDGDIMIKITAGAVTKTTTLIDFSAI